MLTHVAMMLTHVVMMQTHVVMMLTHVVDGAYPCGYNANPGS